jgi:hypothetical protein
VNAKPRDSRAPRTRSSGRASFRDVDITTGPPVDRLRVRGCGLELIELRRLEDGWLGGMRRAKKAGRVGPVARLNAQGRVGHQSRHIAFHLALHRLLSAPPSVCRQTDRLLLISAHHSGRRNMETSRPRIAPIEAQQLSGAVPQLEVHDAKLVPNGFDATASAHGSSRGKGVLAA